MGQANRPRLLILFLPQEWKNYHRRPHWEAMAKQAQLLIIEPPAGILTAILQPRRLLKYFKSDKKLRQQSGSGVATFRPIQLGSPGIDFILPFLSGLDRLLMRRQLKKVVEQLHADLSNTVTFIVHVYQHHFSRLFPNAPQCYEITDLYVIPYGHDELNENHWYTKRARRYERKIIKDSDIVITSSRLIFENLRSAHSHVHYLHNSADYAHFSKSENTELEIPAEIKGLAKPVLGFIGYLNHLIDFELLAMLSNEFTSGSIVIIGSEQKINRVTNDSWYQITRQTKNIHYLGFKDYETLPAYLKGFDVCLLPFRSNEWMRYSAPNKTFQYLATGKPVVSTDFPEMRAFKNVVHVADNHNRFINMVREAINENSEAKRAERKKIALENSTDTRAVKVMSLLNGTLKERS